MLSRERSKKRYSWATLTIAKSPWAMTFWLCIPIRFTVSAPERKFTSIWIRRVAMDYLRMIRKVLMKVCWETRIHDRFPWKESRIYDCIRSAKARRGGFEGRKNAKLHKIG